MAVNNEVLALILGGGQGSRLFPLTQHRSKPAVPIGGKYRLIDIPISNCLHADIRRIFVLTQFNSASLNRHIAQTYRMDLFSPGFVEILAAEQTPDNPNWFQGTADAVRQARRHFERYDADYYLILAGDQLYRMDYCELVDAHIDRKADITIAAQPVDARRCRRWAFFASIAPAKSSRSRRSRIRTGCGRSARAFRPDATFAAHAPDKPFVASMGIYVFSRDVLLDVLAQQQRDRLRTGDHPWRARSLSGALAPVPRLLGGRGHRRIVLRGERDADAVGRAVQVLRSAAGRSTRIRASCRARV